METAYSGKYCGPSDDIENNASATKCFLPQNERPAERNRASLFALRVSLVANVVLIAWAIAYAFTARVDDEFEKATEKLHLPAIDSQPESPAVNLSDPVQVRHYHTLISMVEVYESKARQ
jgi:hypothetical protein